ncbi:hypothetical protein OEZ60_14585 [Defluviimonas sp. WL0024]|uniref:Transmembrane protein (PGPGW) n=2 Tax=Albidovulum TaxID=205889 RepID=A0ABT3J4M8_9RHOB|nr:MULTISPECIES: hypothetical protein [Defluviimonas]MCU9849228.1 hypothetical protein [Defluviimonas sp. WL0024]MCW3782645.1 hypothetical protein [Defluviimonas salinarum]
MALIDRAKIKALAKRSRRFLARVNRKVPPGLRTVLGLLLIVGGFLGFLPVLGFWMIPLGIGVVWLDIRAFRKGRRNRTGR